MINNSVSRLIRLANSTKPEKYNILTFPTHERYETQLCKTGHNFYSFHLPNLKKWNTSQLPLPTNYYVLAEQNSCDFIGYDFILSQSKFWQFQVASQLAQKLNIPIISLEHTIPTYQTMSKEIIENMKSMIGDVNVFISQYSQNQWEIRHNSVIIHHGIDTNAFKPLEQIEKNNTILTVANDFKNRDYCLNYSGWLRVTEGLNTRLVGETKGLSSSASCTEELVEEYNKCGVYFNSSTLSPIPTSLLEAMACGCAVVSTATCMIPEIIQHGVNGFISNDENELRSYIEMLLVDNELANTIGHNARETILQNFNETNFVDNWNNIFDKVYEVSTR
jgi:glycosyltransferase involved in cell wall biosynthesis